MSTDSMLQNELAQTNDKDSGDEVGAAWRRKVCPASKKCDTAQRLQTTLTKRPLPPSVPQSRRSVRSIDCPRRANG